MITIQAIDHIVLRANNPQQLIDFYCNILACHVERTIENIGLTQLRAGNALIDIVAVDSELGRRQGAGPAIVNSEQSDNSEQAVQSGGRNLDHFCLSINPIDPQDLIDYLDQHQVPHGDFADRYGSGGFGDSIYIDDPEGNVVELKAGS